MQGRLSSPNKILIKNPLPVERVSTISGHVLTFVAMYISPESPTDSYLFTLYPITYIHVAVPPHKNPFLSAFRNAFAIRRHFRFFFLFYILSFFFLFLTLYTCLLLSQHNNITSTDASSPTHLFLTPRYAPGPSSCNSKCQFKTLLSSLIN